MGIKGDMLEHYADKQPQQFLQIDAFCDLGTGDDVMVPDSEGDCLFSGMRTELMGGSSVRVLIRPETTREEALRALKKIRKWLKRDWPENEMRKAGKLQEKDPADSFYDDVL